MLKKSTKLTALLVAAASVVSIVPASAAERLGTKDGTVRRGFAFDGGKYLFQGYRTDDDDDSIYFNNGDKDKEIQDAEDYDLDETAPIKYGEKYVLVKNDGDDYLLDVTTGKVDDDESIDDKVDNAKSKLYTQLKKADRYSYSKDADNRDIAMNGDDSFKRILADGQDKYGDVWYQYKALGDSTTSAAVSTTGAAATVNGGAPVTAYVGFASENGSKYVDVCNDANIYALVKKSNGSLDTVKLSEYDDEKDGVKAQFISTKPIAQDKDYIYTVTTVKLIYTDADSMPTGINTTQTFLQKIAKAQGDKKDDAYLPKSTTSYQLDTKDIYDNGDLEEATKVLTNTGLDYDIVSYEVKGSTIYATGVKSGNVKVWALKLKKAKIDTVKAINNGTVEKNVDTYAVMKDDDWDHDIVGDDLEESKLGVSIDVDGNTWALDKGKLYKFTGSGFDNVYTCDRALDRLDVYNEDNLIIWESDGDVYTNVAEDKKQTADDAGVTDIPVETVVTGWNKNADGTWSFYDATGTKVAGKWVNVGGYWYYLKADGVMATGWLQEGGNWYFLTDTSNGFLGAMKTGWIYEGGSWYYLNQSGAMVSGWFQDVDGNWYFLKSSGAMAANEYIDGYYLGANGAWVK